MDWKNEAVNKLKKYSLNLRALENLPDEILRLNIDMSSVNPASHIKKPLNGGSTVHEDVMLSNIVLRKELTASLKKARLWVKTVDNALDSLDHADRRILELMYIYPAKGNVDRLCSELGREKSAVYEKREKALRAFTISLYGSE